MPQRNFVEAEERRVAVLLGQSRRPQTVYKHKPYLLSLFDPKSFTKRVMLMHRDLVDRWGGWYTVGSPVSMEISSPEQVSVAGSLARGIYDQAQAIGRRPMDEGRVRFVGASMGQYPHIVSKEGRLVTLDVLLRNKTILSSGICSDGSQYFLGADGETVLFNFCSVHTADALGHRRGENYITLNARVGQRFAPLLEEGVAKLEASLNREITALRKTVASALQSAGEKLWTRPKKNVRTVLTCSPSSFLLLGHYKEPNSCFKGAGQSEHSKLVLATDIPNSFVALFYDTGTACVEKMSAVEKKKSLLARAWGMWVEDSAILTNFYNASREEMRKPALKALQESGLVKENADAILSAKANESFAAAGGSSIFTNKDTMLFGTKGTEGTRLSWISGIVRYAVTYGYFVNSGRGLFYSPGELLSLQSPAIRYGHVSPGLPTPGVKEPPMWPYPDILPRKEAESQFLELYREGGATWLADRGA